ncbi:hypothetical protein [Cohnella sp. GCM10027633]|uniref:hypothetical protein n=1 Tax=unclassified Cohnella TaxID=2636738 RepID=UPI00363FC779
MNRLNVLSHGAGVQTSCMVYMVLEGEIPRPDLIVFADPQWELDDTYKYLNKLMEDVKQSGIPMMVETAGDIYEDTIRSAQTGERAPSMPFYTDADGEEGIVGRQCTNDYKIEVVRKAARTFLGLKPRQRYTHKLVMWKGITTDEIERITDSKVKSEEYHYPLFDLGMNRLDCMNWLERKGYGVPPKSSCVGCPFHSRQTWVDIAKNHPVEFQKAVKLDRMIRHHKKFKSQLFLHKDRMDLEEAVRRSSLQGDLFDYEGFGNDCSGSCGV